MEEILLEMTEKEAIKKGFELKVLKGFVRVKKYNGKEKKVVVASKIDGKPVKSIEKEAFEWNDTIEEVFLPPTIEKIGVNAFRFCRKLKKINIPNKINIIEQGTFDSCEKLKEIILPEGLTVIAENAFSSCYSLENFSIPDSVEEIKEFAFSECKMKEQLNIPSKLDVLSDFVFYQNNFKEFIVPNNITTICSGAFAECKKLESIIIPETVTSAGWDLFRSNKKVVVHGVPGSYAQRIADMEEVEFIGDLERTTPLEDENCNEEENSNPLSDLQNALENLKSLFGVNEDVEGDGEELDEFIFGEGITVKGKDFKLTIPENYVVLENIDGKEIIACSNEDTDDYCQSPLNIQLGRAMFPDNIKHLISVENFIPVMRKINESMAALGVMKADEVLLGDIPALITYTRGFLSGNINHVAIFHGEEYYQLRITFNGNFKNMEEITLKIVESFIVTKDYEPETLKDIINKDDALLKSLNLDLDNGPLKDGICSQYPLDELINEDFSVDGKITQSVALHILLLMNRYDFNTELNLKEKSEILNDFAVELMNIVDFNDYKENVLPTKNIEPLVIKALLIYTARDMINALRCNKVDSHIIRDRGLYPLDAALKNRSVVEVINEYKLIIADLMNILFNEKVIINEETLLGALGSLGIRYKADIEQGFDIESIDVDRFNFINNSIEKIMSGNHIEFPYINGKINGTKMLHYFSNDILFFKNEFDGGQIAFDGKKHIVSGFEMNSELIWAFPEILFKLSYFFQEFTQGLTPYLENNNKLSIGISKVKAKAKPYFNREKVTGTTLFNIFAYDIASFIWPKDEEYVVHLDKDIKKAIPEAEAYLTELVKTLREYNDLSMDNINLNFSDFYDIPNEVKDMQGIERTTKMNVRILG